MSEIDDFKQRYKKRLEKELQTKSAGGGTADYEAFRETMRPPSLGFYEKMCNAAENILPVEPDKEQIPKIQEALRIGHLNVTPTGTMSFAALTALAIILVFGILGWAVPFALTGGSGGSLFLVMFGLVMAGTMIIPLTKLPFIIANTWKMKASNQMVLAVFYVVTFMRHTPNLELAIDFAAKHLGPPLSLDLRKVMWDVETGRYDNVSAALDEYLETWRDDNPEFIEAMHLIESSLHESSKSRRESALDKSLDVILDETYEKMLHFTHDLKGPINMLHMLGIILPVLGLIILPMLTSFVPETRWYHIGAVYNIFLPVLVYYMGRQILSTRPTGYGGVDVSNIDLEEDDEGGVTLGVSPANDKKPVFTPLVTAATIMGVLVLLGFAPLFLHAVNSGFDLVLVEGSGGALTILGVGQIDSDTPILASLLGYKQVDNGSGETIERGPYGLGSTLLSVLVPLGLGVGSGYYYKLRSGKYIEIREETKELEDEFSSALFQLGNRLGDGVPAEIAFSSVADVMQGTKSGKFFKQVSGNVARMGMSVRKAIFDKEVGAIKSFPSTIIESSMKVFLQSIKKGPMVASQALLGVAQYIKSMHRVDERLKDLLADILSSMKTQASILTPAISGVVVGITSLISSLLNALSQNLDDFGNTGGAGVPGGGGDLLSLLEGGGVPNFYFQIVVGLYVVQITYILSIMINGIQNGNDETYKMYLLGKNLTMSTATYAVIALGFTIGFSFISANIVQSIS